MGFRKFIYRDGNKELLRRLFINGKGRIVGKSLYNSLVATELGMQRIADKLVRRPQTDQLFLNKNLTAVVKTFERPAVLERLVSSIRRFYPKLHIIVVDDSREPEPLPGVETVLLPFNSGVSVGRNAGVMRVKTPYVLMLDDDFVFCGETRLGQALKLIESEPQIDLMGGHV